MAMRLIRFIFLLGALGAVAAAQAQPAFRAASSAAAAASTINFRSAGAATTANDAGSTNCGASDVITPAIPAGSNEDMLFALVMSRDAATISASAGWTTSFTADPSATFRVRIFTRVADGSASDTLTVTKSGAAGACSDMMYGRVARYNGIDIAQPFEATVLSNTQTSTAVDHGGGTINAQVANSLSLFAIFAADDNTISTAPTGFTLSFTGNTAVGSDAMLSLYHLLETTTGNKGAYSATMSASDPNYGVFLILRPSGGLTLRVPAGVQLDDVMLANVAARAVSPADITAPAGWTLIRNTQQADADVMRLATWWRRADATDAAGGVSYTWTFTGTAHTGAAGAISAYSGIDTAGNPYDAENVTLENGNAATAHAAPSLTATSANSMLVTAHALTSSTTWTPPAAPNMTERADVMSLGAAGTNGIALGVNDLLITAAGSTGGPHTASAASNGDEGASHSILLRPLAAVNHYAITFPNGNISTCDQALVRIVAHDAAHAAVAPTAGTSITLDTSTGTGIWTTKNAGTGTWTPSNLNDGKATYAWPGGETTVELYLRHNTTVTGLHVNINAATTPKEDPGEDATVNVSDSVLQVATVAGAATSVLDGQIAGKKHTEGHQPGGQVALYVQAPTTGSCAANFANLNVDVEFAAVCNNPATCIDNDAGDEPQFRVRDRNNVYQPVAKNANTPTPASYTTVSLAFDASSRAPLDFVYNDAGQVTLHMRATRPTTPPVGASFTASGSSNAFVVRPFGIAIRGANEATTVAHSTTAAGTVFAAAGDAFTLTLAAYKWASTAQDANADGFPDFVDPGVPDITLNGLTPNFKPVSTAINPTIALPSPGTVGEIRRGANCPAGAALVADTSWSGGAATITDLCYTEAGNVHIAATVASYIVGTVQVLGQSMYDGTGVSGGYVGRFRPKHFAVSGGGITSRAAAGCAPASSFSYMDERVDLALTLTAQNAQNATTANYRDLYAKLDVTTTPGFVLGARSGTTNLTSRLDTSGTPTVTGGGWVSGVAAVTALPTMVRRATPDNPDGPYASTSFGIAPVDSDTVAMNTLDLDVDNDTTMDRKNLGIASNNDFRFGRLRLQGAMGSEKLKLPMPFVTQYWDGKGFVTNTLDNCTTLGRDHVAMSFTPASNLSDGNCETALEAATIEFNAGVGRYAGPLVLTLSAPGTGNNGSVLLTPQLRTPGSGNYCPSAGGAPTAIGVVPDRTYLLGRWNDAANPDANANTMYDDNPSGRAAFGVYGSQPSNFIYFRENH